MITLDLRDPELVEKAKAYQDVRDWAKIKVDEILDDIISEIKMYQASES